MTTPSVPEIRARLAVIEGEWWSPPAPDGTTFFTSSVWQANDLIAHAPADLRWLCDRVEALEAERLLLQMTAADLCSDVDGEPSLDPERWAHIRAHAETLHSWHNDDALAAQPAAGTDGGAG